MLRTIIVTSFLLIIHQTKSRSQAIVPNQHFLKNKMAALRLSRKVSRIVRSEKILCVILVWLAFLVAFIMIRIHNDKKKFQEVLSKPEPIVKPQPKECRVPFLDPFDPQINYLVKDFPEPLNCHIRSKYPILFNSSVDPYPYLKPAKTLTEFKNLGIKHCFYRIVQRATEGIERDSKYSLDQEMHSIDLNGETKVPQGHNFIAISCKFEQRQVVETQLVDTHAFVHEIPSSEKTSEKNSDKLNVIILGLDSLSRMSFYRSMTESHNYLMDNLNAVEMTAYHKIADNTFPNVGPMLTNQPAIDESVLPCEHNRSYDNCTFLWNEFEQIGYSTLYAEDDSAIGGFNLDKLGFKNVPTNYYLRPFLVASNELVGHHKALFTKPCFGPRSAFNIMLKYMQQLSYVSRKQGKNYFQFVWSSSVTHEYVNGGQLIDKELKDALKWWKDGGYLNDTLLVVVSDHGLRWGEIRQFFQGQVEDRLPLMYVVVPPWFEEKYTLAYENLLSNRNRLVTMLDLGQTLRQVLAVTNFSAPWQPAIKENQLTNGLSLFQPIPKFRTCEQAGIQETYCTCNIWRTKRNVTDEKVKAAVKFAVEVINKRLSPFEQCAFLFLQQIMLAGNPGPSPGKNNERYRVSFRTVPGNATFEALVLWNNVSEWSISGQISRTNMYGNQSHCVNEKRARLYCYCKDLIV